MIRRHILLPGLFAIVLIAAPVAQGAGSPVPGGPAHRLASANGAQRYRAQVRHGRTTLSLRSRRGRTLGHALLPGSWGFPIVAFDNSVSGLSADGGTLVLVHPRTQYPVAPSSTLVILDARTLHRLRLVKLRGDFSVDAISPTGRWLYLIQNEVPTQTHPIAYKVRALDVRTGRLKPGQILDPRDRGEKMQGMPVTRVYGPGGRWAYTLYAASPHPFVHALDTSRVTARCIDLAILPQTLDVSLTRLHLAGSRLLVTLRGTVLSVVDTRTMALVRNARAPAPPHHTSTASGSGALGDGVPIALAVLLTMAGVGAAARRRLRRNSEPPSRQSAAPL